MTSHQPTNPPHCKMILASLTIFCCSSTLLAAEYVAYRLLEAPGTSAVAALALSSRGTVTGGWFDPSGIVREPILWNSDGVPSILPRPTPTARAVGFGFDLTDPSRVTGHYSLGNEDFARPAVWDGDGGVSIYPSPQSFGTIQQAAGSISVGSTYGNGVPETATVWYGQSFVTLEGFPLPNSRIGDVNRHGKYTGSWGGLDSQGNFLRGGFVGENGTWRDLDLPGMRWAGANDINDHGALAGVFFPEGSFWRTAFFASSETEAYALDVLPGGAESWAGALNNAGYVVGRSTDFDFRETAVIWEPGSPTPIDLNTLVLPTPGIDRWVLATDINESGQILIEGAGENGGYYVLTPVPEPAAVAVGSLVVLAATSGRRRRAG